MPVARWWQRRIGILYGDQTCFMDRDTYARLGGIRPIPLMEDVAWSDALRRGGGPVVLLDPPVRPDYRRFESDGRWRRKLANLRLILRFRMGVDPEVLWREYYRGG